MKIQPSLLADGKFPIIAIDAFGVSVKGDMFGGELDAQLIGGILKLDSNYNIIGTFDSTTPVAQRVFYLGIEGGFSMAGMAGFTIRLGLSELGPLQVLINVEVPGGLLLEPITGLSMNDFVAGVEFFKTLPSIDDPFALRNPDFQLPTQISVADWLTSLQGQVARQAKTLHDNPGQSGFAAAFTSPMMITGSAKIYTIYTSQEIFNGQVTVKISTDGKILIIGTLNFAHDLISISGRLYADLSKISSGNATVLFLADVPDQVRLLTIYGKLKMGFTNASGEEVTFDVVDAPTSTPAGTATPTAQLVSPAPGGGSVDINVVKGTATNPAGAAQDYLDVVYRAPSGASLDYSSIINATTTHFTVSGAGFSSPLAVSARPTPMATLSLDDGLTVVPLTFDSATNTVWRWGPSREVYNGTVAACVAAGRVGCRTENVNEQQGQTIVSVAKTTALARETVATAADLPSGTAMSENALLAVAAAKTGTNRFRYSLGTVDWALGDVTVSFPATAFKNADTNARRRHDDAGRVQHRVHADVHRPGRHRAPRRPGRGRLDRRQRPQRPQLDRRVSSSRRRA